MTKPLIPIKWSSENHCSKIYPIWYLLYAKTTNVIIDFTGIISVKIDIFLNFTGKIHISGP